MHGYASRKESFFYQAEYFCREFKVTAPDFLGFGASSQLSSAWSVGDYASWLRDFIIAAKLERPHIVAHSFGARVAIKLLAGDSELCDKLIITGGAGLVKERSAQYIRQVKRYRRVKKLFPAYAERKFGSEEYRTLSPLMRESYKKIVNEDLRADAARIKNKTLLIYGESDTVTPVSEEGAVFNGLISGSELYTMKGGHFCFCEYPDVFNEKVEKFLKSR